MRAAVCIAVFSIFAFASEPLLEVPSFSFKNSEGNAFGKKELAGDVWVASFIFTHCQGQCPLINAKTQELRKAFSKQPGLKFVSISVDPERDTPAVLAKYAGKLGADSSWVFLTGPKKQIDKFIGDGLKLVGGNGDQIAHSPRFVLVDSKGWVRGYYNALDDEKFAELKADLQTVLAEPRQRIEPAP